MKNDSTYKRETLAKYNETLKELMTRLPEFMQPYFVSKRKHCQTSTLCGYAEDLIMFLEYLIQANPSLQNTNTRDISLDDLNQLTFMDIDEYADQMLRVDMLQPATVRRRLSSIRTFFRFAYVHELLSHNAMDGVEGVKVKKEKTINRLSVSEANRLVDAVENTRAESVHREKYLEKTNLRDAAIVTLLLRTGIRVSELVGLDVTDVDFHELRIRVIRKGGQADMVYFDDTVAAALDDYIQLERHLFLSDRDPDALFRSMQKRRMTVRSVQLMVKKFATTAIPEHRGTTCHSLRRTYGSLLYEASGGDIRMVAKVLGHDRIETTSAHYIADGTEKERAAKLDPYRKND